MLLLLLQTIFVKKWGKVAAVHNRLVDRLFHLRGAEAERKIRGRREQQRWVAVAEGKRLEEALRRTREKVAAIDEKIGEEVQDLGREVVAATAHHKVAEEYNPDNPPTIPESPVGKMH